MSNIYKTSCFKCGHRDRSEEKGGDDEDKIEEKGWCRGGGREVKQQREVLEEASNDKMIERE